MLSKRLIPISVGLLISATTYGESSTTGMDVEIETGVQHDSTLSVNELDRSENLSDMAHLIHGKLNGTLQTSDQLTLKGGYAYTSKNYQENSEFDFAIHQLNGDASYKLKAFTLGASHHYAMARLDNNALLDLHLSSINLSKLLDDRFFFRIAGSYQTKDFDDESERNAVTRGVDGDLYIFFNQARSFVSFGVGSDTENAQDEQLQFDSLRLKSSVQNTFDFLGKQHKVALSYQFIDRDYGHITTEIDSVRQDQRQIAKFAWELAMLPQLDLISALEYGDYSSNLDSVDYTESLASVAIRFKL